MISKVTQKLFLQLMLACCLLLVKMVGAQESKQSPEVAQMLRHAHEYMSMGNYRDAMVTYKQAMLLAPHEISVYEELARLQIKSGDLPGSEQTLATAEKTTTADDEFYRLYSFVLFEQGKAKAAARQLQQGMSRFPLSGALWNEEGREYAAGNEQLKALRSWIAGIHKDPLYAANYKDATKCFLNTDEVLWGLLYGEIYLGLPHDTIGDDSLKIKMFASWKYFFDHIADKRDVHYGNSFEQKVAEVFSTLTPVVSDGITTENLVMVRTRFLMEWYTKYPDMKFSLFSRYDELVRNGKFEIYTEWLFGKAESEVQYESWNKFHDGDMLRFIDWNGSHHIKANSSDYTPAEAGPIFNKEK